MNPNDLKIAVVGAGAIGGVTAALMTKAGWDPILVCKHADTLAQVTSPGLVVTRLGETHTVPVRGVLTIAELPRDLDIVFHATKANDCVAVARELLPYLHEASIVVSMQNGISEDALAGVLGRERVAGCVENLAVTLKGPGEIDVTSEGAFILGHIDHKQDERIKLIQPMLDAVQPTRISDNIMGELYAKLMFNACINALTAINGVSLGKLLAVRKIRSVFIALMQETLSVADAVGIRLAPAPGGLNLRKLLTGGHLWDQFKRHLILCIVGIKHGRIRPSTLQSLERGRPTEIDYLNGYICDRAAEHAIPVPVNQAVVTMVKEIEAGKRPMTMANMDDPLFAGF
ncbi:MAG: 2-dehydropantoate 2-reductase [Desulfobacterales bacterium]|nr:2-dehydropantoate 2-reductase [Desulfobacterales bacterium]